MDGAGQTGRARVGVTVRPPPAGNTPPLVTISAPLDGHLFAAGQATTFTGSATDLEDGVPTGRLVGASDLDRVPRTRGNLARALRVRTPNSNAAVAHGGGLQRRP